MEPTRPPRFLDDPPHICPVLGPRSSRCVRPLRHIGAAPVIVTTKASATITFRGSIARLLCSPPTLRARVAPMLRKDGFWLPASFTRWAWSPTGSFKKVSKCYCPSSPFSKFSLARNDLLGRSRFFLLASSGYPIGVKSIQEFDPTYISRL